MPGRDDIQTIVHQLKQKVSETPRIGIVCGSGLGSLATLVEDATVVPYEAIDKFPRSTVQGHQGELVFGRLSGQSVMLMRGRFHPYEGYAPAKVALPVRVMAAMGVRVLIVTNAAGGLNPEWSVGDIMSIEGHIYLPGLAGANPLVGPNDDRFGPRFPAVNSTYESHLASQMADVAEEVGMGVAFHKGGTYACVSGPSYETPHEIAMLRTLGADAVGMSTVPEVIAAAHCGMKVVGMSLITNVCVGPDEDLPAPTHTEVLEAVKAREPTLLHLVSKFVAGIDVDELPVLPAESLWHREATPVVARFIADANASGSTDSMVASSKAAASSCPFAGIGHWGGISTLVAVAAAVGGVAGYLVGAAGRR
jgi:purine-nucleoside phosphorylase